jgi:hypothetical protein
MWEGFDLTRIKPPMPGYADRRRDRGEGADGEG